MRIGVIIGLLVLALAWLALAVYTFVYAGFNLKNLLIVVFSGIIIFVPLWKKYVKPGNNQPTI